MRLYEHALNDYIKSGKTAIPASAQSIACNSCNTLANATVLIDRHEAIVREATQLPCTAEKRILTVDRAAQFLASAISPPVLPCGDACSNCDVRRFAIAALLDRSFVQATVFKQMSEKNALLLAEKQSLKKSQAHCASLLKKSIKMQQELRRLTQQLISAQEDERLKISRELHDVIAQTLTGINIRLATLKQQASLKGKDFNTQIDSTQRMVEKSVNIVHRFAFDLRPPVIDDLGLSSALRSLLKKFEIRTRIKTYFRTCSTLDQLDTLQRTALFRVAEEALTNVARHSGASCVIVSAKKPATVCGWWSRTTASRSMSTRSCFIVGANGWDCWACVNAPRWSMAVSPSNHHRRKALPFRSKFRSFHPSSTGKRRFLHEKVHRPAR